MRPKDIQAVGDELAIKWDDGSESYIKLETLRRHCPCAACKGEVDVMGNLCKGPDTPLSPHAFQLVRLVIPPMRCPLVPRAPSRRPWSDPLVSFFFPFGRG